MSPPRVDAARARARAFAQAPVAALPDGGRRARTLAIGDPQAPLDTFLEILDAHDALGDDGRLREDTALVSMGDHFDWGKRDERDRAGREGMAILSWLAAHPADQAIILLGNHDLARVGELVNVSDDQWAQALAAADPIAKDDADANRAFREQHGFFSAELVSRDFSAFRAEQRDLVDMLLRARRLRLAWARGDMLFVHAGITLREIDAVGLDLPTPSAIAEALNRALDDAVARRAPNAPLHIDGVHHPGSAEREGSGALYHRPSRLITDEQRKEGRRFDPRTLPRGVVQVIGHIRDKKCRELLADWCDDAPHALGVMRSLTVDAPANARDTAKAVVHYRHGVPDKLDPRAAHMLFLDGGMNDLRDTPRAYQLLDVERRAVAETKHG